MKKNAKRSNYKDAEALKKIGEKIREIRIISNMSQQNLAYECEFDYSQINRMELGKVNFTISSLYKIAAALKVNPKELLD